MPAARCECGKEFRATAAAADGLCPACQAVEDAMYANDPAPVQDGEYQPWRWSPAAMRERLGVTGRTDD